MFDVFYTIQGEGPCSGIPAVFVRLAGCNLQCILCDTDYTSKRTTMEIHTLAKRVEERMAKWTRHRPIVVITGGEPFRQNVWPFINELIITGNTVQLETNGTYDIESQIYPFASFSSTDVLVVCSPKTPKIHPSVMKHACALKYVVEHDMVDLKDGLPISVLGTKCLVARPDSTFKGEIYISPLDEGDEEMNRKHRHLAAQICMRFGYRLSLQTHKYIGVP